MKITIHSALLLILTIIPLITFSQNNKVINIENPSYEGHPRPSSTAKGWYYCGFNGESPPDIQPGYFNVGNAAKDGNTYAGIVTRSNGTFENLKINLSEPTKENQCYEWTFFMSQSKDYESISRTTLQNEMFTSPVNIVVYGAVDKDDCKVLDELGKYDNIHKQEDWIKIKMQFQTEKIYESLVVSVQPRKYANPKNGHILLDYFHPIIEMNCEEEDSPTFQLPVKMDFLSFLDTLPSKEEKIKHLIDKINLGFLHEHFYLEYQLYMVSRKKYRYDNVYLDELIRLFPEGANDELILLFKTSKGGYLHTLGKESMKPNTTKTYGTEIVVSFLQKYMEQRNLKSNVTVLDWDKKQEKKYREFQIESPHKAVSIFIKN